MQVYKYRSKPTKRMFNKHDNYVESNRDHNFTVATRIRCNHNMTKIQGN